MSQGSILDYDRASHHNCRVVLSVCTLFAQDYVSQGDPETWWWSGSLYYLLDTDSDMPLIDELLEDEWKNERYVEVSTSGLCDSDNVGLGENFDDEEM